MEDLDANENFPHFCILLLPLSNIITVWLTADLTKLGLILPIMSITNWENVILGAGWTDCQ